MSEVEQKKVRKSIKLDVAENSVFKQFSTQFMS